MLRKALIVAAALALPTAAFACSEHAQQASASQKAPVMLAKKKAKKPAKPTTPKMAPTQQG